MILGKLLSRSAGLAPLFLRLAVGAVFVYHGASKLGIYGGEGIQSAIEAARIVGFSPPEVWGWALALTEFVGGLLLIIGLFTRYAALALAFVMGVAAVRVTGPHGFNIQWGGAEYNVVLIAACLALLFRGGGTAALDNKVAKWMES